MRRIGIFGGTFDPPHRAHYQMAQQATALMRLDLLFLVPAWQAPLKNDTPIALPAQRAAMLDLMAGANKSWQVLTYEIEQARPVPTIETLEYLMGSQAHAEYYVIVGKDQAKQIHRWYRWEDLAAKARFLCFAREGDYSFGDDTVFYRKFDFDSPYSSSGIRQAISEGIDVESALMPQVYEYINTHGLYR
ncbi:MAG: nicotinate (nicotinamide) nucleotide adenylyltransferase [Candidatus Marinimicrobia bacterium]|nr:nicotinate (nicotinamide) nucleotide adenylyltransferase [Candidatus Neomarinimicrobiota bacterium]